MKRSLCLFLLFCGHMLWANPPLTYAKIDKSLLKLWKQRYPVKLESFKSNPTNRGILQAIHKGNKVFYYRYIVKVYRPYRGSDEKLKQGKYFKKIELWVRYRPHLITPFDLSFARVDLLPGKNKKWIKL